MQNEDVITGAHQPVAEQSTDNCGAKSCRSLGHGHGLGVGDARSDAGLEQQRLVHQEHNEQGARQIPKEAEEPASPWADHQCTAFSILH